MSDKNKDLSVYEIGYLIASSVAEDKASVEADTIKKFITDAGGSVIADEAPHRQSLAYEIRVKQVSGLYEKYTAAYFGWVKFEAASDVVEGIKKSVETHPTVIRMLLISTVRENTYLGKGAPALADVKVPGEEKLEEPKKDAAPATIEEMDKSIDEMVKEV